MPGSGLTDLYELFQHVRQRPSMFVRDCSLDDLETMCRGYSIALGIHGIEEFGTWFQQRFHEFLFQKYGWSMCLGWARGIRDHSGSAEEAFHRFFELVEKFKLELLGKSVRGQEKDRTEHAGMSTALKAIATPSPRKRPLYRLSVDQYEKMVEAGVFRSGQRIELIEGFLVEKMTHNPPHAATIDCLQERLRPLLPDAWRAREQKPIRLSDSEPEPDLTIVQGPLSRYAQRHPRPADIALVVEVADSTLGEDREDKGRMYARAHLSIYWIINLRDAQIEVYTQPKAGKSPGYRDCQIYGVKDSVPLVIAGQEVARIPVRELLPSLSEGEVE
jgi:hypothetical protein